MSVQLNEQAGGTVVAIELTGKLTKEDYEQFIPGIERLIDRHGKVRMLVRMHDFHGWTAGAVWQDVTFDLRHFRDIERLALITETGWERGLALFCRPFTSATIRTFNPNEIDKANAWIEADLPAVAPRARSTWGSEYRFRPNRLK